MRFLSRLHLVTLATIWGLAGVGAAVSMMGFAVSAHAAEDSAVAPRTTTLERARGEVGDTAEQLQEAVSESATSRRPGRVFGGLIYSPIDLLIPSKFGVTLGIVENPNHTWELEYLRGTIKIPFLIEDLGEWRDEKISLIRRSYFGTNSFNISYGLTYFRFKLRLGNEVLSRVSGGQIPPGVDFLRVEGLGPNFGIGNRWSFKNGVTLAVDWATWSQPLITTKKDEAYLEYSSGNTDARDRDHIDTAVKLMQFMPRLTFFKFELGYQF